MIDKLKNILNFSERYYVLLISKTNNGTEYQLIEILFKGNDLKVEKRLFSNNFEEIVNHDLNNNYPMILHIEGENIINKCVEKVPGFRKSIIFKSDPNEFYFFEYHQDETVYISVSRKQYIDEVIKRISDINLYVIHLSFGPFVMANLISIIKGYDTISSPNYTLNLKGNEILSFNNKSDLLQNEYEINGDVFNQKELPLLAAFLDYKYPNPNIEFDRGFLSQNITDIKFKKWFKITGVLVLIFFLTTLPVSHYLMGKYVTSLAEKESLRIVSQQTIMKVNALKEEKNLKEKILLSSGISKKDFLTKYIMDIGNSVPQDIVLNAINVMPPFKKTKKSEKVKFDISTIKISGECESNKIFNDWLKTLENLSWIKKIDIKDYTQETKLENTFLVSIQI